MTASPRTEFGILPTDGKLVVAAPHVAVRMVEQEPAFGPRVFTLPGIPEDMVYVLDIDALNAELNKGLEMPL